MLEYCITFFKEAPGEESDTVVFHCHVTAPDEMLAVEVALRRAQHGTAIPVCPASSHLH